MNGKTSKREAMKDFLTRKKQVDGKLSPLGEWLLSDDPNKLHVVRIPDMKAVLK